MMIVNNDLPVNSVAASRYPAEQYDSCPSEMSGLSYNWSAMTTLVNNMSPNGNTNQGIGLSWGWLTLVGGGVFTIPAKDPSIVPVGVILGRTNQVTERITMNAARSGRALSLLYPRWPDWLR